MKKESLDSPLTAVGSGLETSYWRLGAFLVVSGILSGLVFVSINAGLLGEGTFAQNFALGWLPGVLFGLAVATAVQFKPVLILSYSTLTGVIYFLAFHLFMRLVEAAPFAIAGALTGVFGAFLVVLLTALFLDRRVPRGDVMIVLLPGLLAGIWLGAFAKDDGGFLFLSSWVVWQVPVGLLLHRALQLGSARKHGTGNWGMGGK